MNPFNKTASDQKLAWQLTQTAAWTALLKPMLEHTAHNTQMAEVHKISDTIAVARQQAEQAYARMIINRVERLAREFTHPFKS